jgi:hypothetical protein
VRQARAVIRIDGRPVAIYCLRLLPPLRSDWATANRVQFADLKEYLEKEKLPAIVAGDFNFTRRTRQGRDLRELGYLDAHQWVGKGRGGTWPANHKATWLPLMQLDHVYLSPGLVCTECRTGQAAGSDHLPVIARVGFATSDGAKPAVDSAKSAETSSVELPKTDLEAAALAGRGNSSTSVATAAAAPVSPPKAVVRTAPASLPQWLQPERERAPWRDPVMGVDGSPPPRRDPWSPRDAPPDREPDPPPLRAPTGSR